MRDDKGIYYFPFIQNKKVRMYVREVENSVWFRIWDAKNDAIWKEHNWVPYDAIKKAASVYNNKNGFDPNQVYDIKLAKTLIKEQQN